MGVSDAIWIFVPMVLSIPVLAAVFVWISHRRRERRTPSDRT